jgi:5-oxoprolinase (ATP-hydrolysing)
MEQLQGCDATTIGPGEAIVIQTPTAGGYGDPNERKR